MSTDCDEIIEAIFLGQTLGSAEVAHVETCGRCQRDGGIVRSLSRVLAEGTVPEPPSALTQRVLAAAAPALGGYAASTAKAYRWHLGRALAAALFPLPAIFVIDTYIIRILHTVLDMFLPAPFSMYLVFHITALMLLTVTLTYGVVPVLADRQIRLTWGKHHT